MAKFASRKLIVVLVAIVAAVGSALVGDPLDAATLDFLAWAVGLYAVWQGAVDVAQVTRPKGADDG